MTFIGASGAKAAQASILPFGMSILPSLGPGTVNIRLTESTIIDEFLLIGQTPDLRSM